MQSLATVQTVHVRLVYALVFDGALQFVEESRQQLVAIGVAACQLFDRYGVGYIALKLRLVHVQSDAYHAVLDAVPLQSVFNQHAAYLLVAYVNVVRPFYFGCLRYVALQGVAQGYRYHLGNDELCACRYLLGVDKHREKQVLAPLALPCVGAATLSSSLKISHNHHHTLAVFLHPTVGRIGLINVHYLKFHHIPSAKLVIFRHEFHEFHDFFYYFVLIRVIRALFYLPL